MKMFMLYTIVLYFLGTSNGNMHAEHSPPRSRKVFYNKRCTRRYTPGSCAEPVAVVWTYVFQMQNCTERLGCPNGFLTNRFASYRQCVTQCAMLAEVYSYLLAYEAQNETTVPGLHDAARREGSEINEEEEEVDSIKSLERSKPEELPEEQFLVNPHVEFEGIPEGMEDVWSPNIDDIDLDGSPDH